MWVWEELSIEHYKTEFLQIIENLESSGILLFISLVWKVMDFDQVVMESHGKWLKINFIKKN